MDYCTSSPDKIGKYNLSEACKIHDEDYKNQIDRKEADLKFRDNINKNLPNYLHFIGYIYYYAVRIFGRFFY